MVDQNFPNVCKEEIKLLLLDDNDLKIDEMKAIFSYNTQFVIVFFIILHFHCLKREEYN